MQVSRALRHEMDVAWILRVLHLCKWCLSVLFQGTGASLPSDATNVRACQCSCKRLRRGAPEFQLLPVLHSAARSSTLAWPDFAFAVSSTCGKQSLSKMELVSGSEATCIRPVSGLWATQEEAIAESVRLSARRQEAQCRAIKEMCKARIQHGCYADVAGSCKVLPPTPLREHSLAMLRRYKSHFSGIRLLCDSASMRGKRRQLLAMVVKHCRVVTRAPLFICDFLAWRRFGDQGRSSPRLMFLSFTPV